MDEGLRSPDAAEPRHGPFRGLRDDVIIQRQDDLAIGDHRLVDGVAVAGGQDRPSFAQVVLPGSPRPVLAELVVESPPFLGGRVHGVVLPLALLLPLPFADGVQPLRRRGEVVEPGEEVGRIYPRVLRPFPADARLHGECQFLDGAGREGLGDPFLQFRGAPSDGVLMAAWVLGLQGVESDDDPANRVLAVGVGHGLERPAPPCFDYLVSCHDLMSLAAARAAMRSVISRSVPTRLPRRNPDTVPIPARKP